MIEYLELLNDVLENGKLREDRTGVGTRSVFGRQIRFDLQQGFPLLTTKKIHTKSIVHELLWFLSGSTNVKYLKDNGVKIWDAWADKNGDLGPVYGKQWRNWDYDIQEEYSGSYNPYRIDQIKNLIENLKNDPFSRRHIVSAWNVAELPEMALMPCHTMFQFYVEEMTDQERANLAFKNGIIKQPYICLQCSSTIDPINFKKVNFNEHNTITEIYFDSLNVPKFKLSCQLYQRSGDIFLGVPFNIASYALLTHMIAQVCNMAVGEFVHTFGDLHLYTNHIEQAKEQLTRSYTKYNLCNLELNPKITDIDNFTFEDIKFIGYESYPTIKGAIAV